MKEEVYSAIFTFDEHATPASLLYLFRTMMYNGADLSKCFRIEEVLDENGSLLRYDLIIKYKEHDGRHHLPDKVLRWLMAWGYADLDKEGNYVFYKKRIEEEVRRRDDVQRKSR